MGFALLHTISDNWLLENNEFILGKLSSIQIKILNDIAYNLNWIEFELNGNSIQLKFNSIQIDSNSTF